MTTGFVKMHGCGNDFVILDGRRGWLALTPTQAAAIADRHTGIGCDQLIVIGSTGPGAAAFMQIFNPDGSQAAACGNATRCVASLIGRETGQSSVIIRTSAADLLARLHQDGEIQVDMGPARFDWSDIPLARPMDTLQLDLVAGPVSNPAAASMGNPHVTFFVDDLAMLPIQQIGPLLEHASLFPERANIGFAQVLDPTTIRLRVWERGAGLTLACGSGACAALVNAHRRGLADRRGRVIVDGGSLLIEWCDDGHVLMTGPAVTAFTGQVELEAFPK
jgi:diaminopimelate epimerase